MPVYYIYAQLLPSLHLFLQYGCKFHPHNRHLGLKKPVLISRGHGLSVDLPEEFLFSPLNPAEFEEKIENFFNLDFYKMAEEKIQSLDLSYKWENVENAHLELILNLLKK